MKAKAKGTRLAGMPASSCRFTISRSMRVPLSGAIGSLYPEYDRMKGDVRILPDTPYELRGEVKARRDGSGFKVIEKWLMLRASSALES